MQSNVRFIASQCCLHAPRVIRDRHAYYYICIAEDIADLTDKGGLDGLLLGGLLFNEYLIQIKQAFEWLLEHSDSETRKGGASTYIKNRMKVWSSFGGLRFFVKDELIPQMEAALGALASSQDTELSLELADLLTE